MRRTVVALAAGLLSGCLTLYSKTEVVRSQEPRRPVVFECPQAAELFHKRLADEDTTVGSTYVGVPFVTVFARRQKLAESAAWNDAVARCDTDANGIVSVDEATIFSNNH